MSSRTTRGRRAPEALTAARRSRSLAVALLTTVAALLSVGVPTAAADAVIDNGVVQLGVNHEGHLNVPGATSAGGTPVVGLRYVPTNFDSTAPGCACEGWGVGDKVSGVAGFANESTDGGANFLRVVSFTADADSATSVVDVVPEARDGATGVGEDYAPSGIMRVTHEYAPSAESPNAYAVRVTVRNISGVTQDIVYRRVMDWDVEPTATSEFSTIDGSTDENGNKPEALIGFSDNGFETANPLRHDPSTDEPDYFTDRGPNDIGARFDFGFGALPPGAEKSFVTYYGAAGTEQGAIEALAAVGAEVWSLGQPNTEDGPTLGTPNTFFFGFGSVGGTAFADQDSRAPLRQRHFQPTATDAPGGAFDVTVDLRNIGQGNVSNVSSRLVLPSGLSRVSGADPATIGTLEQGRDAQHTWRVDTPETCEARTYTVGIVTTFTFGDGATDRRETEGTIGVPGTCTGEEQPPPRPVLQPQQQQSTTTTQRQQQQQQQQQSDPTDPGGSPFDGLPAPEPHETFNAATASGRILVRLPGSRQWVPLGAVRSLPIGTRINARNGHVLLQTASNTSGGVQQGEFWDGVFETDQAGRRRLVTELELAGTNPAPPRILRGVKASAARIDETARAARRPKRRRLWGSARGNFRSRGNFSAATVRGTKWLVEDRCDVTVTLVREGVVRVRDFVRGKSRNLMNGEKYRARAKKRC